jgi:anti-sigma factor RsiW
VHNDATEAVTHEQAFPLLTWLANGTLTDESAGAVRAHLSHCAECRAEYDAQVRLCEAMREDGSGSVLFPAEVSFQKLMGRIDSEPAPLPSAIRTRTRMPRLMPERAVRWLAAAVIVEALGLGLAVWALQMQSRAAASYVTLSSPAPAYGSGAVVRVVFEPGLTLADLQQLLQGIGARVIDGPTQAGVFTLGFTKQVMTDAQLERRAATLRADPHVRFAEPLSAPRGASP